MRKSELAILDALADVLAIAEGAAKGSTARAKIAKGSLAMTLRSHADLMPAIERYRRLRAYTEEHGVIEVDDWLHGLMATGLDVADIEKDCAAEVVLHSGQRLWGIRAPNGLHITGIPVE